MITKDLNVCLFPMTITWDDVDANLKNLEKSLNSVHPQTDLVVIPETFSTGFPIGKSKDEIKVIAGSSYSRTINTLKDLSNRNNFAIAGTLVYVEDDKLFNRAFFVEPNGDITFADKRHLFSMAGEDKIFSPGNNRLKIRYRGWNIAMIVCYDLRFPIWSRNINNDYDILLVSANWPEVRISAWNKLLPARAIENLSYICGVDCTGTDNKGFNYDGSSMIIDFKGNEIGKTLPVADDAQRFIYATLSRTKLDTFREKFPAWRDADQFSIH